VSSALALNRGRLPVERADEAIVAWRTWSLGGDRDGREPCLHPVARTGGVWEPLRPCTARCRWHRTHRAPDPGCSCGLHGAHSFDLLRHTKFPAVLGRVALWGRVVEHDLGYRARFGYPQRVRLVCRFCFWQWGPLGRPPEVVAWFPRDELIPMCEAHLVTARHNGMRPRSLLAASAVEQTLRERYAVDPLAI
jgi:hypothetical protein